MALFFQRDASLVVYPETSAGAFDTGADTAYTIPLLEGFSFSQTTNSSEVTLSEMESTGGSSRRGRKTFNDSLAPVEWSFSTYLRPFLSQAGAATGCYGDSAKQHLVDEVLWNALMAKGRMGELATEVEAITVTNAGSGYTSAPTVTIGTAFAASTALALNAQVFHGANLYTVTTAGTTHASTVPVHTTGAVANGSATLTFASSDLATATAVVGTSSTDADYRKVKAVNVTSGGTGYTVAPAVAFSGGAGSSAAATATVGDADDSVLSRGGSGSTLVMDTRRSNKSALETMALEFNLGGGQIYRITKAVVNSATVNFDVEGIATVEWSGMGATIASLTSHTVNASNIDEGGRAADTSNFIRNRLTSMSIAYADGGASDISPINAEAFALTVTGGSISFENNISYLTPEELGTVNKPIEHVTGVRNIGGSFTCYLATGTGGSKEFFDDLVHADSLGVTTHDFAVTFNVGGSSGQPRVAFTMPHCHVEVPSHSIEDVISLETSFSSLQSNMESNVPDDFSMSTYGGAL